MVYFISVIFEPLIVSACSALLMLIIVGFMVPKEQKEQKGMAIKTVLLQAIVVFFVLAIMNHGGTISAQGGQKQAQAKTSSSVTEKVVGKPAPFAKSPVKEDDKSSKAGKEKRIDASLFNLIDPPSADGHFIDGTPYFNYEIESGDTVFNICQRFGIEMTELKARNNLEGEHPTIYVGKFLKVTLKE